MANKYQQALDFTLSILRRLRLRTYLVHPGDPLTGIDDELRKLLGSEFDYADAYNIAAHRSHPRTIYKSFDQFMCHYIHFYLPGTKSVTAVVIGPYLTEKPTQEFGLELLEELGLPATIYPQLIEYYTVLPVFHDPAPIFALVSTLGEKLWGDTAFDVIDVYHEHQIDLSTDVSAVAPIEQEDILLQMQQVEERYILENELMETVSKGLTSQAEVVMYSLSRQSYRQRTHDPLRNMKNYCVISNTILRKAAQQGGVHPFHLDRTSGQFARAIEGAPTLEKCGTLVREMIRTYCNLVRTHAEDQYSSIIQKTLTYIDANLSGDLSLPTLADRMQVSPSYLSALFRRETGKTLTDRISEVRMATALKLLKDTRLQVQTIAQMCGFTDSNYFGRQFKRYYGITPLQSRK